MTTSPPNVPAGGPRSRRLARAIVAALGWALVAALAWFLWPSWLGGQTTIISVSGNSMEPMYHGGDVVIARTAEPAVGDVVIYEPEGYEGAKIVHRIIGGDGATGWELQGDNNEFVDPFTPTNEAVIGVARVHIPFAGVVLEFLTKPWVWGGLLLGMAALLLWPSRDDDDDNSPDADARVDEPDDDRIGLVEQGVLALIVATSRAGRVVRRRVPRAAVRATAIAVVAGLAAATAVVAPHVASASALNLSAVGVTQRASTYCWPTSTSLTAAPTGTPSGGSYTQLRVSGLPAACAGNAMTVRAYSSAGAQLATGTATAAAGSVTVTTAASFVGANVAYVVVTIGAPRVATVSTAPATCVPTDVNGNVVAGTCTVANVTITDTWGSTGSRSANATFQANSSSGWFRITFDFSKAPFPGWNPRSISGSLTLPPTSTCAALPLVTVRGPNWSNSQSPTYAYYFGFSETSGNICP